MVEALEQVRKITSERGYRLLDDEDAEQMDVRRLTRTGATGMRALGVIGFGCLTGGGTVRPVR